MTGGIYNDSNKKDVEIARPLKYLSSFLRIHEMSLINGEIKLFPSLSVSCVITNSTSTFAITDTKLYSRCNFLNSR